MGEGGVWGRLSVGLVGTCNELAQPCSALPGLQQT